MSETKSFGMNCPLPLTDQTCIKLAHGGGGRMMQKLIEEVFFAAFDKPELRNGHDGAVVELPEGRPVLTTDSYVVQPLFFPGGDIGALSVTGTVNDLAMCGARPIYLSVSFILEEGLETETLWRVVRSMRAAADEAGIHVVTGDTKVVERGHGDGIYINTTGVGVIESDIAIKPESIESGDAVIISGDVGRHGMAVLGAREELAFATPIESDCAPLWTTVAKMLDAGIDIHCLRDATRGGLCAVLNELAQASGLQFDIVECDVPIAASVRGACEVLGLDALQIACEGRFIAVVPTKDAEQALEIMQAQDGSASLIGRVSKGQAGLVTLQTPIGGRRILDMPAGELLPRIC